MNPFDKSSENFDKNKQELAIISSFKNEYQNLKGEMHAYFQGFQLVPCKFHPDFESILALP